MDLKEARLNQADRHPWEGARLEVVTSLWKKHLPQCRGGACTNVLDIGCGDAWLVEQLAERFPRASFRSVDPALSDCELEAVHDRLRLKPVNVFRDLDAALDGNEDLVDLVLMLDVLEHIADDDQFLTHLASQPQIGRQTSFLITVPAWQELFCSHDEFLGHYRRYTVPSLCEVLQRTGFAVEQSGYYFSGLMVARYTHLLAERFKLNRPGACGVSRQSALPLWDALLRSGLILDFKLGQMLRSWGVELPGLSCFAVARPRTANLPTVTEVFSRAMAEK